MGKSIRKLIIVTFGTLLFTLFDLTVYAQCAMCRASMENSISESNDSFSAGLNTGILYLFVTPYLAVGIIAFLWYRSSKKNGGNIKITIRS